MMNFLNIKIFVFLLVLNSNILAQITVNNTAPYNTPQYLVENVLVGSGVLTSNWTYNGSPLQLGFFSNGLSSIGLDSGIVICTDEITGIDPNFIGFPQTAFSTVNNTDLLSVANSVPPLIGQSFSVSDVNDVAILEFDFVPSADTVKFRFAFGSDEYLTFVNTSFNDVFAFFIAGPGITGPYSSPAGFLGGSKNIAIVPGTTPPLPITISSVNNVLNATYYIDNPMGLGVGLNGYTQVLTATSPVICGETYHIKLAIADGADQALKSAVFLEAASFSSGNILISAQPSYNYNTGDTLLFEGCGDVTVTLTRAGDLSSIDTVYFDITGTATNGVDYSSFPDSVVFVAGQSQAQITFTPIFDGIIETPETIIITVQDDTTACGFTAQTIELTIYDPYPLITENENDTLDCFTDSLEIFQHVISGLPPFEYSWSIGLIDTLTDSTSSIFVNPTQTSNYFVTVTDGCGIFSVVDTIEVFVPEYPVLLITGDTSVACPGDLIDFNYMVSGGISPYEIWWENSLGNSGNQLTNLSVDTTTLFTLFATDKCAEDTAQNTILVTVPVFDALNLNPIADLQTICPGNPISFFATAYGGSGNYSFTWDNWITNSNEIFDSPWQTTSYTIQVTDYCNTDTVSQNVQVLVPSYPPFNVYINNINFACVGDTINTNFSVSGGAGIYSYYLNNVPLDTTFYSFIIKFDVDHILYVKDICNNDTSIIIESNIKEPIANFVPVYYDVNDVEFINLSEIDIVQSEWQFGDGNVSTLYSPQHSYESSGEYNVTLSVVNDIGCTDTITQKIKSPFIIYIPNSFTPNGDGKNDSWGPVHNGMIEYSLQIINRWGEDIFNSDNPDLFWDGKDITGKVCPLGVYTYIVKGRSLITGELFEKKGMLALIK